MHNSDIKGSLKKLEFPTQTPQRGNTYAQSEFYSSQKLKYEGKGLNTTVNATNLALNNDALNNQKDFFESQIPIRVRSNEREEYQTFLNFKISSMQPSQSHSQVLHLEITDETNHLFLYVLDLNETAFLNLKTEANIVVDFQAFPQKLVELLELAIGTNKDEEKVRFACVLDIKGTGEASFNVCENNCFQNLIHLSLKFREATDSILKTYLANRLTNELSCNEDLRIKIERLDEALTLKTADLERNQMELRKFHDERERAISDILQDEKRKMNEAREAWNARESGLIHEFETERKCLINQYEQSIRDLSQKFDSTSERNQNLSEVKLNLESSERELQAKVRGFEREIEVMSREVEQLRGENKQLDALRFSHEKQIAENRVKIESLESQVKNKDEVITKNTELQENAGNQRNLLEESISEYKRKIEKLEKKVLTSSDEIHKGNEVIDKLQSDIEKVKGKLKMKNQIIMKQEEEITQFKNDSDDLQKKHNNLIRDSELSQFKIKDLENSNLDLKTKLNSAQATIQDNASIIDFLNKKVNENQRFGSGVRIPFTNKFSSQQTSGVSSTSPYKAYGDSNNDLGLGGAAVGATSSLKYSTSNMDKYRYNPQNEQNNFSGTSTTPLTFSKTLGTMGGGTLGNEKQLTAEFEREAPLPMNKENNDFTNRSLESQTKYTPKTYGHDFTSTSSIDMSAYNRQIQPIAYKDPNHK